MYSSIDGKTNGFTPRENDSETSCAANSERWCSSLPHSGGGEANSGGLGMYLPRILNMRPIRPSGVQLTRPIAPPGRQTRTSSSATT